MTHFAKYGLGLESYPHGMNRNQFIKEYKKFLHETGLHAKDCVVGAGGSCLLFGLRDKTNDIDMSVPQYFFDKCKESGKYEIKKYHHELTNEDTEVIPYNDVVELHIPDTRETIVINGVYTWSPKEVYDFKVTMNRPKDQEDIKKLKHKYHF